MEYPHTAIVKVTNGCNLGCSYCYAESSPSQKETISISLVEKLLRGLGEAQNNGDASIIWHGGEPLSVGLDFYERVAYMQYWLKKKEGLSFSNSIQTNGSLVTLEVVNFCNDHHFSLGFSLDGPKDIHGLTRSYPQGQNSFDQCFKGLSLARKAGLSNGAIIILNARNVDKIDEIYDFFKIEELGMKINPLINAGNAIREQDLGISPQKYASAMIRLFDRYVNDFDFKGGIDPLDTIMGNVSTGNSYGACNFGRNCQLNFFSVNHLGEVYPCGRFDGVNELCFGDLNETSLREILRSPVRQKLLERSLETVVGCKDCDYGMICNSGCLNNAYNQEGEVFSKDYYCAGYKRIFEHIDNWVQKELNKAKIPTN